MTNTENTPLLSDENEPTDRSSESSPEASDPRPVSWYVWRALWFVIAASILAIFIKGWIDAGGDVEVCQYVPLNSSHMGWC